MVILKEFVHDRSYGRGRMKRITCRMLLIGGLLLSSAFPLQAQMSPVSGPGSMEQRPVREPGAVQKDKQQPLESRGERHRDRGRRDVLIIESYPAPAYPDIVIQIQGGPPPTEKEQRDTEANETRPSGQPKDTGPLVIEPAWKHWTVA